RLTIGDTAWVPLKGLRIAALLFGLVLLWAIVQLIPGAPSSVVNPSWEMAAEALGRPLPGSISVDPFAGIAAIARLTMYALALVIAYQDFRDSAQAMRALRVLAIATTVYAIYGLVAFVITPEKLLWMRRWAYFGDVTSTFVNRNSFATYAGLGLLI